MPDAVDVVAMLRGADDATIRTLLPEMIGVVEAASEKPSGSYSSWLDYCHRVRGAYLALAAAAEKVEVEHDQRG